MQQKTCRISQVNSNVFCEFRAKTKIYRDINNENMRMRDIVCINIYIKDSVLTRWSAAYRVKVIK